MKQNDQSINPQTLSSLALSTLLDLTFLRKSSWQRDCQTASPLNVLHFSADEFLFHYFHVPLCPSDPYLKTDMKPPKSQTSLVSRDGLRTQCFQMVSNHQKYF